MSLVLLVDMDVVCYLRPDSLLAALMDDLVYLDWLGDEMCKVLERGTYTNNTLAIANAAMGAMNFFGNVRFCMFCLGDHVVRQVDYLLEGPYCGMSLSYDVRRGGFVVRAECLRCKLYLGNDGKICARVM